MFHIISLLFLILFGGIFYIEIRKWFLMQKLRCFNSPKQLPILGVAARFLGKSNDELIDVILGMFDEVKSTPFYVWSGPILFVGISEPKDIQIILSDENCLDKPYLYEHLMCKSSIIATNREIWKPDRRALNVAFNLKILHSYIPLINEKAHRLLRKTEAHINEAFDLYQTIFICMLDTISRTTMGVEIDMQSEIDVNRGPYYYGNFRQIMENIQYRMTRYWLRWDFTYSFTEVYRQDQRLLNIGNELFETAYKKTWNKLHIIRPQQSYNARNFLEKCIQMEYDGIFNRINVLDQMRLIVFAGTDTLSITVFSTLLMLAINQKHQDLVVKELRSIFDSADCDVTHEHLTRMQYLDRVIKETHRILAPVPFIGRKTSADIDLPKGTVPKGTMIIINIMHLHRNPKIWGENVLEFEPDRFLPENIIKRPPFSFIPFSAGPRNCIGMKYAMISAKIILVHLLRRYKFTTDLRFEDIRVKTHLVLEVINDKPLRIERRKF